MNIDYDSTLLYRRSLGAFIYRPLYNEDRENE